MPWYGEPFDVWLIYPLRHPCNSGSAVGVYRTSKKGWRHVRVWESANGPVPHGQVLDHICGNKACSEVTHLEAVTPGENVRRGNRGVTNEVVRAALIRTRSEFYEKFKETVSGSR